MKKASHKTTKPQRVGEKPASYTRATRAKRGAPDHLVLQGTEVPEAVLEFCEQERILQYLRLADQLISQCFADVRGLDLRVEADPETGDKAVVITLVLDMEIEEIIKRSREFSLAWVTNVPWPESDKIHLCFSLAE